MQFVTHINNSARRCPNTDSYMMHTTWWARRVIVVIVMNMRMTTITENIRSIMLCNIFIYIFVFKQNVNTLKKNHFGPQFLFVMKMVVLVLFHH